MHAPQKLEVADSNNLKEHFPIIQGFLKRIRQYCFKYFIFLREITKHLISLKNNHVLVELSFSIIRSIFMDRDHPH